MFFKRKINKEDIIKKYGENNVRFYKNGDYKYQDKNSVQHLIRNKKEICKGISAFSYENGDFYFEDEEGILHRFDKNGDKTKSIKPF